MSTSGLTHAHTFQIHVQKSCSDAQRFAFEPTVKVCDDGSVMLSTEQWNVPQTLRTAAPRRRAGIMTCIFRTFCPMLMHTGLFEDKCTSTVYKFLNLVLFFYSECWFSQCLLTAAVPLQTCTVLSCYSTFCCYRKPAVNVEWLASWHQVHPHHPYHCGPSLSPSPFALRSHCYLSWFSWYTPHLPTLLSSSVLAGSFCSDFNYIAILTILTWLSSWKISCHFTPFTKPHSPVLFSSELRSLWPVIASGLLSICALRPLISGWHPLSPAHQLQNCLFSRLPPPNCAFCCYW